MFRELFGLETKEPAKVCGDECGRELPLWMFPNHTHQKDGLDSRCRDCIKKHSTIRKKLEKCAPPKPDVCPICECLPADSLDHCHTPVSLDKVDRFTVEYKGNYYKFRAWLCGRCNITMGKWEDRYEYCYAAGDLLKKFDDENFEIIQLKNFEVR